MLEFLFDIPNHGIIIYTVEFDLLQLRSRFTLSIFVYSFVNESKNKFRYFILQKWFYLCHQI